jgi:signal transduction histidine kinase
MRGFARWQRTVRDWPLRTKLLAVVVATTTAAVALAGAGIIASDSVLFTRYLERDLTALSQIVADTSTGALAFDDPKAAAETLGALRARQHLIAACIYRSDGSVLATYFRPKAGAPCPPREDHLRVVFRNDAVAVSRPVLLAERPIGTLSMLYGYGEMKERRTIYGGTVLAILVVSVLLASIFSARLRGLITNPVAKLVETVSSVSANRDYQIRAEKVSADEMGVLVDAFNEMLSRIEARDEELRRALAEGELANRRLAQSNEDLERFAFVASHDLQEPLRMVSVYTQLLQKRSLIDSSPETAKFVTTIVEGTRRMHELLADLRAYAELNASSDLGVVDLNNVVNKAKDNLKLAIDTTQAVISHDELPCVRGYEGHLIPLFQNLIGNAIKYRSEKPPRIQISYRRDGSNHRFSVADNGEGIAPEYHAKIFVPFKRLHGPEIPGSGIGLAICERVVQRYGGRIWVESAPGKGATFVFTFPDKLLVPQQQLPANVS